MENNKNITKPFSVAREDFMTDIVSLCNQSGLPLCVMEDVLKNITQEMHIAAKQQLDNDRRYYQEQLEKAKAAETNE